jgi:hypothetical protein
MIRGSNFAQKFKVLSDAEASPTHQVSQHGSGGQLDKPAQILKTLWNCCANLK